MWTRLAAFLFAGLALATPSLADCPLDLGRGTGVVVFSEHFIIALRPEPPRLETGTTTDLVLNVCSKNGEAADLIGIDAQLDEKNVIAEAPRLVASGSGRYRVEGLVFGAPGAWEIGFTVRQGKDDERLPHDLIVN
jgi:hypothetical protein